MSIRYTAPVPSLHTICASTSGHTEYVVDTVLETLKEALPSLAVEKQRAELAQPDDLLKGDVLLLASGSWNTGGSEGQLNPHMHALLKERAKDFDLQRKRVLCIGLGDSRYQFTARALQHLEEYVQTHNGTVAGSLKIVNEPYGQEAAIAAWAADILPQLRA